MEDGRSVSAVGNPRCGRVPRPAKRVLCPARLTAVVLEVDATTDAPQDRSSWPAITIQTRLGTVAPSDSSIVYVGSSEGPASSLICRSAASGVERRGRNMNTTGLNDAQRIQRWPSITRSNRLFAAVLGHPYGPNAERRIFHSVDGGDVEGSWDANTGGSGRGSRSMEIPIRCMHLLVGSRAWAPGMAISNTRAPRETYSSRRTVARAGALSPRVSRTTWFQIQIVLAAVIPSVFTRRWRR